MIYETKYSLLKLLRDCDSPGQSRRLLGEKKKTRKKPNTNKSYSSQQHREVNHLLKGEKCEKMKQKYLFYCHWY